MSGLFGSDISARTRLCAVVGHPVHHSASPAMQNAGIAALGLDWRYVAFDVPPEQLAAAIAGARALGFIGLNLTVPHKLLALEMVDVLDESARRWGAVNTVRFERRTATGEWVPVGQSAEADSGEVRSVGFNTDADAIVGAVSEDLGMVLAGARVVVLGAGGAGRVAALRLAGEAPAALHLINRTSDKALELAREIRQQNPGLPVAVGYPTGDVDLVVNATSLGLRAADACPLDEARLPLSRVRAVYDMIYRPAETPLLRLARLAGCRGVNGLGMLLRQGTRALELWSGLPAPVNSMRQALEHNIYGGPCN